MRNIQNIIKTIIESGSFKTFIRIIQKAGLTYNLSNGGQYTIFAPNDAAFAKFPSEKIENLLNDKDRLLTVIKAHIIAKKVLSTSLMNLKKVKTINGKELIISTSKGLKINDVNIIKSDIECSNGIIHTIDNVLLLK
ncbi:hypothetical protein AYK24_03175 [Thermoplasmatales archaeon SG8-52-4]|nr:MAG: hypothetical protein AYK24_03175 [Thermoplasmatales archaeon SG8-52-4]